MLKLVKYEFRKNIYGIAVMAGILVLAQIYFMYAYFIASDRDKATVGAMILFFCAVICFFMVFAFGISTYSRELNNRTSYLVFMTPNKAIKIIGSKLLFTFMNGFMVAVVLMMLGMWDLKLLLTLWGEEVSMIEMIFELLGNFGFNAVEITYSIVGSVFSFLVSFFMAVTLAYFCITLTATILQNKKIKGLISVVLYLAVLIAANKIGDILPRLYEEPSTMAQASFAGLPRMLFFLILIIGAVVGTSELLERKVSL